VSDLRKTGDLGYDACQLETENKIHEMCRLFSQLLVASNRRDIIMMTDRFNALWDGGRTVALWAEVRRTQARLLEREAPVMNTAAEIAAFARMLDVKEGDDHE
jgi:hypothetical protein